MFERLQERQEGNRRHMARMAAGVSIGIAAAGFLVRWCVEQKTEQDAQARRAVAREPDVLDDKPRRVELPGMSLELPGTGAVSGTYRDGSYRAVYVGAKDTSYEVTWNVGIIRSDAELDERMQAKLSELQTRNNLRYPPELVHTEQVQLGAKSARLYLIRTREGEYTRGALAAIHGTCGNRVVGMVVSSTDPLVEAERVAKSFRCTPDEKQEVFRADVVVASRPGWSRLDRPRLFLANAKGVELQTALFDYAEGSVADVIKREIGAIGARMTPHAGTRGDKVFWTGVDSKGLPLAILGWRCTDHRVAAVLVLGPEGISLDEGISLAETGRCLAPDEKMPDYPITRD